MRDYGFGTCIADECENPAKYKNAGLCGMHYQRQRTRGTTDEPPKRGHSPEALAEYRKPRKLTPVTCGHPDRKHYSRGMCKSCYDSERHRRDPQKARAWERKNPEKHRALQRRRILRDRGITPEEYESMWRAQGGKCANPECSSEFPLDGGDYRGLLQVDHCHRTDVVRGLLCSPCNRALGHADDEVARLEGLISYLASHGSPRVVTT